MPKTLAEKKKRLLAADKDNNIVKPEERGEPKTSPNVKTPDKKELDTVSFLMVEKEQATKRFNEKNTYHQKLLKQIGSLREEANNARDEVLRTHGSMQVLDSLIAKAKGIK